ncbi:2287_t:CDS:1, partial [Dentiscutata heterogama]
TFNTENGATFIESNLQKKNDPSSHKVIQGWASHAVFDDFGLN